MHTIHTPALKGPDREFHVSREARERYRFAESVFSARGHVVFADVAAARAFAESINRERGAEPAEADLEPERRPVSASHIYAMGMLDEVQHILIARYVDSLGSDVRYQWRAALAEALGEDALESLLRTFSRRFPTVRAYRGDESPEDSLDRSLDGLDGRDVALEELLVLWSANQNNAYRPARELFDDAELRADTDYGRFIEVTEQFFDDHAPTDENPLAPGAGAASAGAPSSAGGAARGNQSRERGMSLIELLLAPSRHHPDSLSDQLEYVRATYGAYLGEFFEPLLRTVDVLREEDTARPSGPGPTPVPEFGPATEGEEGSARFSPDRDWMPRLILLAKSTLVWLDQLTKQYGYEIRTLDAIPDAELDQIAHRGFTGLWLIGLWERSTASRRIKQLMGNPEAAASAYSLYDYEIAGELGGWEALDNLRRRLWARGVRVASDMVPNHTGIDGRWVYEHPDWFVQLSDPPYPGYTYNGEDLSSRPDTSLYLEDHYYRKTDAAVTFKRVDNTSGETRYIYHGNDGTSMPWNDTAQLDYLNAEAREAVVRTILHVARNFPIIRFDAAMTLAKKHIQRLWYPAPGQGGDIPSRSEHGLSQAEFQRRIPVEFWREVVDRVAEELPDTLLLAEAFWMMEGYFVRTLGMHRVYNSAFMHMLKEERNEQYRQTIKNTLEYDPRILRRFVNFMNNPDEETAVEQFGKDEKYLGVTTVMITMPGLPMFGHGQVEGLSEKYGMEYRRAYRDESTDWWLVGRHERHIFPLLHQRARFAEVEHFRLYDLVQHDGSTNENVFAYSNRFEGSPTLVVYNNSSHEARGRLTVSSPFRRPDDSEGAALRTQTLFEALGLSAEWNRYTLLRDHSAGLWFIRQSVELQREGLYVELRGYERQVFTDIREVADDSEMRYARLADQLRGAGTPDIGPALRRLDLQPLHDAFSWVANRGSLHQLWKEVWPEPQTSPSSSTLSSRKSTGARSSRSTAASASGQESIGQATTTPLPDSPTSKTDATETGARGGFRLRYREFLQVAARYSGTDSEEDRRSRVEQAFERFDRLTTGLERLRAFTSGKSMLAGRVSPLFSAGPAWPMVAALLVVPLDRLRSTEVLDDWMLAGELDSVVEAIRHAEGRGTWDTDLLRIIVDEFEWFGEDQTVGSLFDRLLRSEPVLRYLQVNEHNGIQWFTKERLESLTAWLLSVAVWRELCDDPKLTRASSTRLTKILRTMETAEDESEYKVDKLRAALGE